MLRSGLRDDLLHRGDLRAVVRRPHGGGDRRVSAVSPCRMQGDHFPRNLSPGDEHPENPVPEYGLQQIYTLLFASAVSRVNRKLIRAEIDNTGDGPETREASRHYSWYTLFQHPASPIFAAYRWQPIIQLPSGTSYSHLHLSLQWGHSRVAPDTPQTAGSPGRVNGRVASVS